MKKILLMLGLCIMIINLASASPSFFVTQSESYNLTFTCRNTENSLAHCSNSAVCNVTINYDNSTLLIDNEQANNLNNGKFQLSLTRDQTAITGEYSALVGCSDGTLNNSQAFSYEVNPTGTELKEGNSILYLALLGGSLFIFILCLWASIVIPFANQRSELGQIIKVTYLKYIKILFMSLTYIILIWTFNLLHVLSISFSILSQYTNYFAVLFNILNATVWPLFIFIFVGSLFLLWNDLKLEKLLLRGLNER